MNYLLIYENFIKSRRNKTYKQATYLEKHHIIPKCMNGSNDDTNLIHLLPRDHFFAHLCLAKAYDHNKAVSGKLWSALMLMVNDKSKWNRVKKLQLISLLNIYKDIARNKLRGIDSPHASFTSYNLIHQDGREFSGNRHEFWKFIGKELPDIRGVFSRSKRSCEGWYLKGTDPNTIGPAKGKRSPRYDSKIRTFYHLNGEIFTGTRHELKAKLNSKDQAIESLINGRSNHHKFWYMNLPNKEEILLDRKIKAIARGAASKGSPKTKKPINL